MRNFNENLRLLKLLHVALAVGSLMIVPSQACYLQDDKTTTIEERLNQFDFVVYGKDIQHIVRKGTVVDFTDSVLEVYCVMKGDVNVTGNITIEEIFPKTPCSGTYMYYLQKLAGSYSPGLEIIVGLERIGNGNYLWQEVNQLESSAFDPTSENWNLVANVLPARKWIDFGNPENGCPKRFYQNAAQGHKINEPNAEGNEITNSTLEPEVTMNSLSNSTISPRSRVSTEVFSRVSPEVYSRVSTEVYLISTKAYSNDAETDTRTILSTKSSKPGANDEIKAGELGSPNNAANCLSLSLYTLSVFVTMVIVI